MTFNLNLISNSDNFIYFVLFGTLNLSVPSNINDMNEPTIENNKVMGRVNIGWTVGEELLFDLNKKPHRREFCLAENECCLLGINKNKLAMLQKNLLTSGNTKDYYALESVLKGNNLIKQNWLDDLKQGKQDLGRIDFDRIAGLTLNKFNPFLVDGKDSE